MIFKSHMNVNFQHKIYITNIFYIGILVIINLECNDSQHVWIIFDVLFEFMRTKIIIYVVV